MTLDGTKVLGMSCSHVHAVVLTVAVPKIPASRCRGCGKSGHTQGECKTKKRKRDIDARNLDEESGNPSKDSILYM